MTIAPTGSPKRCSAFAFARERRSSRRTLSPPSTTCLENFSLPGLLTVTSHFDLPNSSEANSVILFTRAVVATTVAEVSVCIGCLHAGVWKLSLPSQATVYPHRIFFLEDAQPETFYLTTVWSLWRKLEILLLTPRPSFARFVRFAHCLLAKALVSGHVGTTLFRHSKEIVHATR